jgi:hypothetical protein
VLASWHQRFQAKPTVQLKAPVDKAGLFHELFDYADQLASEHQPPEAPDVVIRRSLVEMGAQ